MISRILKALDTKPGTLADDIGVALALMAMFALFYLFWIIT